MWLFNVKACCWVSNVCEHVKSQTGRGKFPYIIGKGWKVLQQARRGNKIVLAEGPGEECVGDHQDNTAQFAYFT